VHSAKATRACLRELPAGTLCRRESYACANLMPARIYPLASSVSRQQGNTLQHLIRVEWHPLFPSSSLSSRFNVTPPLSYSDLIGLSEAHAIAVPLASDAPL